MFSRTAEYALRSMACLARHGTRRVSTFELASQAAVPANYLAKVLQLLANASLISGRRGIGGGYQLARDPAQISLLDILRAVNDIDGSESEPDKPYTRDPMLVALHRIMDDATAVMKHSLRSVTLAQIVAQSEPSSTGTAEGTARQAVS